MLTDYKCRFRSLHLVRSRSPIIFDDFDASGLHGNYQRAGSVLRRFQVQQLLRLSLRLTRGVLFSTCSLGPCLLTCIVLFISHTTVYISSFVVNDEIVKHTADVIIFKDIQVCSVIRVKYANKFLRPDEISLAFY